MNWNPFVEYAQARRRLYESLDRVRSQVDEWLERYTTAEPTLSQLAMLEAMHAERFRLLTELNEAGERFMTQVMQIKAASPEAPHPDGQLETPGPTS